MGHIDLFPSTPLCHVDQYIADPKQPQDMLLTMEDMALTHSVQTAE